MRVLSACLCLRDRELSSQWGQDRVGGRLGGEGAEGAGVQGATGGLRAQQTCTKEEKAHGAHPGDQGGVPNEVQRPPWVHTSLTRNAHPLSQVRPIARSLAFPSGLKTLDHACPTPIPGLRKGRGPGEPGQAQGGKAGAPAQAEERGADGAGRS